MSAYIEVSHIGKAFTNSGKSLQVLEDIDFTVNQGEFICIVGQSGCGKSTLLRAIAGIDTKHTGSVRVLDKDVEKPSRHIGVIFQESRLFDWLTVEQNIGFALNGVGTREKQAIVQQNIDAVGLKGFEKAYPYQLSGGMAKRVSIARALVNNPDVLLLDEPFGALDAFTKIQMQHNMLELQAKNKTTMILVTHDIEKAVYLADRVIVMSRKPGRVKTVVHNTLARPRDRNSYDFTLLKKKIYNEFFADQNAPKPEYCI